MYKILVTGLALLMLTGCGSKEAPPENAPPQEILKKETVYQPAMFEYYSHVAALNISEVSFKMAKGLTAKSKAIYIDEGELKRGSGTIPVWESYQGPAQFTIRFTKDEVLFISAEEPKAFFLKHDLPKIIADILTRVYEVQNITVQTRYYELLSEQI